MDPNESLQAAKFMEISDHVDDVIAKLKEDVTDTNVLALKLVGEAAILIGEEHCTKHAMEIWLTAATDIIMFSGMVDPRADECEELVSKEFAKQIMDAASEADGQIIH